MPIGGRITNRFPTPRSASPVRRLPDGNFEIRRGRLRTKGGLTVGADAPSSVNVPFEVFSHAANAVILRLYNDRGDVMVQVSEESGGEIALNVADSNGDSVLRVETNTGNVGIANAANNFPLHINGRICFGVPDFAPIDGDIGDSQVSVWLDEGTNELTFRVRDSGSTLKTGSISVS